MWEQEEFNEKYIPDNFENYIIKDSIQKYNKFANSCQFLWNGLDFIERWELQRKIDNNHAKKII